MAKKWVSEFTVPPNDKDGLSGVKAEDGGQAMIMYAPIEDPVNSGDDDGCFFVRLQSWDEKPRGQRAHRLFRQLMGKKVRVTIETID